LKYLIPSILDAIQWRLRTANNLEISEAYTVPFLFPRFVMRIGIGQADSCSTNEISQAVVHLNELKYFQKKPKSGNPPGFSGPLPGARFQGLMLSLIGWPDVKVTSLPAVRKGLIVSAVSSGLVVWPSSAAGTGDKAHIV
jgi:hypothetical protein